MLARLLDIDLEAELRRIQDERARNRSRGRHLSDVLGYHHRRLEPNRFKDDRGDPSSTFVFHKGFIWEDVLSAAFARQFGNQQLELEVDGIFMTLDGWRMATRKVKEYKATKISARENPRSKRFAHWHERTMGYMVGVYDNFDLDAIPTRSDLVVLHLNGSYELGGGRFGSEVAKAWELEYTPREIKENWDFIRRTRDEMDRKGL